MILASLILIVVVCVMFVVRQHLHVFLLSFFPLLKVSGRMLVIFTLFHLKIEAELGPDEEAGDPEANGELELSRVSEMRIILADPNQCILLH
jgi:hypothetical protein